MPDIIGRTIFFWYFCRCIMTNNISHTGIIEAIEGGMLKVRIVQTSACAACKVASHCSAAESKEKTVEVYAPKAAERHQVGDDVVVTMSGRNGRDAVIIAFVIPLVIMLVVMAGMKWLTGNDGLAALTGVLSLVPYYLAVFLLRGRLARKFAFDIEN